LKLRLLGKEQVQLIVGVLGTAFALFHLYTAYFGALPALQQRGIHLAFIFLMTFLSVSIIKKGKQTSFADLLFAILGAFVAMYVVFEYRSLSARYGLFTGMDLFVSALGILLVLEASRRLIGNVMAGLAVLALLYAVFGNFLPGAVGHTGLSLNRILAYMFLSTEGIFGVALAASATYVVLFVLFASFLEQSGGGDFFIDIAFSLFGRFRGGPAKMAVVASGLFGSISGSAIANTAGTGTFTIPLMKKVGFTPEYAGAVEAISSAGGQLMPPVMGAAAFLIAEVLGISYWSLVIAAAVPALLYYLAVFIAIDREAASLGLSGIPKVQLPNTWQCLKKGWLFLLPIVLLIYLLATMEHSTTRAVFWSIIGVVICVIISGMLKGNSFKDTGKVLLKSLSKTGEGMLEVAVACATAGIIIGVFSLSGLGLKLSTVLINLSSGNLTLLLVLTAISSIILGMGLPTIAAYIICSVLVAPALVQMGVAPIAAHFFVFYFAILAVVTPPVALGAYTAAGISKGNPAKTGFIAFRLGLPGFLIPFAFSYNPALLLVGSWPEILLAFVTATVGCTLLATATQGYTFQKISLLERLLLAIFGFSMILPGARSDLLGFAAAVVVIVLGYLIRKKNIKKTRGVA